MTDTSKLIDYKRVVLAANQLGPNEGIADLLEQIEALSEFDFRAFGRNNAPHITFATNRDDVSIPDHLLARYPEQITLAIQHQFDELKISQDRFSVRMWFNKQPFTIALPFDAITQVYDPKQETGFVLAWGPAKPSGPPPARRQEPRKRRPGEEA